MKGTWDSIHVVEVTDKRNGTADYQVRPRSSTLICQFLFFLTTLNCYLIAHLHCHALN